jgi:hypothetical protein
MKIYFRFGVLFWLATFISIAQSAHADNLANCSNSEGYGYFVAHGMITEKNAGWDKEKISDGSITLSRTTTGYDILFMDSRKAIVSSVADGAKVMLMSHTKDDAIFLVAYPNTGTVEIFKFFQDSTGAKRYAFTTTRSNAAPIAKMSLLVGDCTSIDFENIK